MGSGRLTPPFLRPELSEASEGAGARAREELAAAQAAAPNPNPNPITPNPNPNPLGEQARRVWQEGALAIWRKPLASGEDALLLFNGGAVPADITAVWPRASDGR